MPKEKQETPLKEPADKTWDKCTRWVEVKLSDAELRDASKKLADAVQRKGQVESKLETLRTQIKAEIAELEAHIMKNTSLVANEREFRNLDCRVEFDWKKGEKTIARADNGEILATERITDDERQMHLV